MSTSPISIALILVGLAFPQVNAQTIGSGHPGMKVITGPTGSIAIYRDEAKTFGIGLMGGFKERKIDVIVDVGYHFNQSFMDIPQQLFPFDLETAFSSSGGSWTSDFSRWDYSQREYVGYRFTDNQLSILLDIQKEAAQKYHLSPEDVFLGFIGNKVFFWKGFDPSKVYWREPGAPKTYCLALPSGVIDIYGAVSGMKKDIALSTFSKSRGFVHYSPNTHEIIEIKLSAGIECAP